MSAELNGVNPSFTIRRNIQQVLDDRILVDELRKVITNSSLLISFIKNNCRGIIIGLVLFLFVFSYLLFLIKFLVSLNNFI